MTGRLLIARVGTERIALAVESVREVIDLPHVMPLPLAPAGLAGQFVLRGALIPILDPAVVLGIPRSPEGGSAALVLADGEAALWVDDAEDVWESATVEERPIPAGSDRLGVLRALLQRGAEVVAAVDAGALRAAASATLRRGL